MLTDFKYQHDPLPGLKTKTAEKVARQIYDEWMFWKDARQELEHEIWKPCDEAYMCYRELPKNPGMPWLDTSSLGESDIHEGINFLARSIALSLMPRDESYLQPLAFEEEDQALTNRVRDFVTSMARKADLRGQYAKHLKQVMIRGTGAIGLEWSRVYRRRRQKTAESILAAAEAAEQGIYVSSQAKRQMLEELVYNGPKVRPLDMYDVYPDPMADLSCDHDIPVAIMTYRTLDELESAEDSEGNKLYGNLKGLEPWGHTELSNWAPEKYRSLEVLGVNPYGGRRESAQYVPVLVYHRQYLKVDNNSWVDTYWHIALSVDQAGYRLIRVEENPNDYGHRNVFFDSYTDWIGSAYGIGAVEKSLSAWQKKNIMAALSINAAAVSVFPPMAVITDILTDDRGADISPGGYNPIKYKPSIGTQFMAPIPVANNGLQNAMQSQQFYGQQILGQLGAYGAIMQDPTKTIKTAKTATQVNTENTSGSVGRDDLLEQITTRSLEPLVQAMYDSAIQYMDQDDIRFERTEGGDTKFAKLERSELNRDRRIIVTGWHGLQNKQQEIAELKEALQVMVQGQAIQYLPNAPAVMQKILMRLLGRLGIQGLDQLEASLPELAQKDPQLAQMVNQMAAQRAEQFITQWLTGEKSEEEPEQALPGPTAGPVQRPEESGVPLPGQGYGPIQ